MACQALHAIGNIATDTDLREVLMVQGALQVVLEQLNPNTKLPVLRKATWCLASICGAGGGGPGRSWAMIAPAALTILPHLLGSEDEELLTQGCRALAALGEARSLCSSHPPPLAPRPSPLTPHPSPLAPHPSPLSPTPSQVPRWPRLASLELARSPAVSDAPSKLGLVSSKLELGSSKISRGERRA